MQDTRDALNNKYSPTFGSSQCFDPVCFVKFSCLAKSQAYDSASNEDALNRGIPFIYEFGFLPNYRPFP